MAATSFKGGLFVRLLTLCVLVAVASAAIVTIAFYSYREALTTNRLAAELSAQAFNTIADDVLHELYENREDVSDLCAVTGMVLQTFAKRVANGQENVLRDIA